MSEVHVECEQCGWWCFFEDQNEMPHECPQCGNPSLIVDEELC